MSKAPELHSLTAENMLRVLPLPLAEDPDMKALAQAVAESFARIREQTDLASIYTRIDELPESLLDLLAVCFKIDWWDPEYSLEEKRQTFKDSMYVHRHLGTKAAVVRAIRAIYPHSVLEEWFDYDAEPYHFRLTIDITDDSVDSGRMQRVLSRLNYYKNLRSHNDGVRYLTYLEAEPRVHVGVARMGYVAGLHVDVASELKPIPTYHTATDARYGVGRIRGVMHINVRRDTDGTL